MAVRSRGAWREAIVAVRGRDGLELRRVDGCLVEPLGAARLVFALDEANGGLRMQSLRFLGIPCPAWLWPRLVAEEAGDGGRVVGYRGHLVVPHETAA
jgi:hypothetical protein